MKKQPIEVNGENARRIRKGSIITHGRTSGKVITFERIESFGYKLHSFTLENGEVIKVIESTL